MTGKTAAFLLFLLMAAGPAQLANAEERRDGRHEQNLHLEAEVLGRVFCSTDHVLVQVWLCNNGDETVYLARPFLHDIDVRFSTEKGEVVPEHRATLCSITEVVYPRPEDLTELRPGDCVSALTAVSLSRWCFSKSAMYNVTARFTGPLLIGEPSRRRPFGIDKWARAEALPVPVQILVDTQVQ